MANLPDNNLDYPVYIELPGRSAGSGFYVRTQTHLFLATARHVLARPDGLPLFNRARLTSYMQRFSQKAILEIDLTRAHATQELKVHQTADVAVVRLAAANAQGHVSCLPHAVIAQEGVGIVGILHENFVPFDRVGIGNAAFTFGYPISIGDAAQQLAPTIPLVRGGSVAGINNIKKTVILDTPIYQGNSGGLVIEINEDDWPNRRFLAIGLVSQFIPFIEEMRSLHFGTVNTNIENSGLAVIEPTDRISELIAQFP